MLRFCTLTVLMIPALLASSCPPKPQTPVVYGAPILETIVEDNIGLRIVPEGPDGSYTILGGRALRVRAQADSNLKVLIDNSDLPRRAQATTGSGWYEPVGTAPRSSSRGFFWDIAVELPTRATTTGVKDFSLTLAYDTVTTTAHPSLTLEVHLRGRDSAYVTSMPRPSEVFVDNTENTKPDNRMETSLVAKGVTLAGWLTGPGRNDGTSPGATGSEDWHYEIFLRSSTTPARSPSSTSPPTRRAMARASTPSTSSGGRTPVRPRLGVPPSAFRRSIPFSAPR
jgi:hypothetical protein